jgi:hypothetical protein
MADEGFDETTLLVEGEVAAQVAALAKRMRGANGPLIRLMNRLGGQVEDNLNVLPAPLRDGIVALSGRLLEQAYHAAAAIGASPVVPKADSRLHKLAAMASGAAGGAAGLASAVIELPATVTLIFGAMQKVAAEHGYDPASEEVRLMCLEILGSGGPGRADDGVNSSFFGARLGINGTTLSAVISRVAPRFGTALGQKLAGQAVPIIGAAAGAGVNWLFMDYYQEMARVRFGLKRLADSHGEEPVITAFRAEMARSVAPPPARV